MIKALLLLIRPVQTWGGILTANRGIAHILCLHLLPLILLTSVAEGYGLMHWGKWHKGESSYLKFYNLKEVIIIETAMSIVLLALMFIGAYAAKSYAATFHTRHTFRHAFTAVAYGLMPMLTLRLGDLSSSLNGWVPWSVGIVLTIAVLYHGLPCILRPDPPHAFGLYVMTSITLVVIFGLLRLVTYFYFLGQFKGLEKLITDLAGVGTQP